MAHDSRPRTLYLACTTDGDPVLIPASDDPRHPLTETESCPTLQVLVEETEGWEDVYDALLGGDVAVAVDDTGDKLMGPFVYCGSHLRVHTTGWCGVPMSNKLGIHAKTLEDAQRQFEQLRRDL